MSGGENEAGSAKPGTARSPVDRQQPRAPTEGGPGTLPAKAARRLLLSLTILLVAPACLRWATEAPVRDGPLAWAEVDGRWLRHEITGPVDGTPVVLIHGFGSSLDVWGPILPELTQLRVLRLDLPGFGRSDHREGPQDIEHLAGAVLAVMDQHGLDHAHVVAHSMGCAVTLAMALAAPERVDRVVLIGPWVYEGQVPWGLRAARDPGTGELMLGLWYRDHLDLRFGQSFYDAERWVTEDLLDAARRTLSLPGTRRAALETIRGLSFPVREDRYGDLLHRTLILQGREDRIATLPFAERLSVQLPRATLEVLPYVGHFPMIEAAAKVGARTRAFLQDSRK